MLKYLLWPGFLVLVIAQWLVPLQMILKKDTVLKKGTPYKFETAPIDPSDPFIGKYIVLNFKENVVKTIRNNTLTNNSKVYVSFYTGTNGYAAIRSIDTVKPQRSDYLETTINYIATDKDSSAVYINYPFDKFYMDEYKAPQAENIYRQRNTDSTARVHALVMIYNGDAVVKDIYVNDSLINEVIKNRRTIR